MSALAVAVEDYLATRRSLGYCLEYHGTALPTFVALRRPASPTSPRRPRSPGPHCRQGYIRPGGAPGWASYAISPATCKPSILRRRSRRQIFSGRTATG
jgi:hypothetical protein